MLLHYFKTEDGCGNFGDELNLHIWDKYLHGFFDNNSKDVFFGIGTILRASKNYKDSKIIVFGSGSPNAQINKDYSFKFYFVRGPLTAKYFELSDDKAITDPAILTPFVFPAENIKKEFKFGYMPHWTVDNKQYREVFENLGVLYISPREKVEGIITKINSCSIMICEAMHAAIVADAYRIPWIAVSTFEAFNMFKWTDWSSSMELNINIVKLPRLYEQGSEIRKLIRKFLFKRKVNSLLHQKPNLSSERVFKQRQQQIIQQISKLKTDFNFV